MLNLTNPDVVYGVPTNSWRSAHSPSAITAVTAPSLELQTQEVLTTLVCTTRQAFEEFESNVPACPPEVQEAIKERLHWLAGWIVEDSHRARESVPPIAAEFDPSRMCMVIVSHQPCRAYTTYRIYPDGRIHGIRVLAGKILFSTDIGK